MKNLKEDIKNKNFKKVYLLYGEEDYLKKYYEKEIKKSIIANGAEIMNLDIFEENDIETGKIIDACETLPFMNKFRLVIIKNSSFFIQGKKNETEKINDYINNIPETSIIVFIENKIDKRNKLFKSINSIGRCTEFKTPYDNDLIQWIKKLFTAENKSIDNNTAMFLIRTVGNKMEALNTEIEKLLNYKKDSLEISKQDIENICIKSLETKIFDLVDAIGNKKPEIALDIYNNMILLKESPIMILSMIARQFRIILQSKYLLKQGKTIDEISKRINQRNFVVKECLNQSRNFTNKLLIKALNDCLECDINIKTGKISDKLGVEMIILNYSY